MRAVVSRCYWVVVITVGWVISTSEGWALPPRDAEEKQAFIGQPVRVTATPETVTLQGKHAAAQVLVSGHYADGSVRDLTHSVLVRVEPAEVVEVQEGLFLRPRRNGQATLLIQAAQHTLRVAITVQGMDQPAPVSFRRDVVAALNVGGCNMGACHGTPSGKNGFRLSLRGEDPAFDYLQLTREQFGRRTDRHAPEQSLIFLKGVGRVPHEGGQRFGANSLPAEMILAWLAQGLRNDPANLPPVQQVVVLPGPRIQQAPARWQQLAVHVRFADGGQRDVTRLSNYSSSDPAIADVNPYGLVEFKRSGEVAILVRYLDHLVPVRLTYLEPKPDYQWPNPPEHNYIDTHVFAKLRQMNLLPSELCSDGDFLRRAYLDTLGRLPTVEETRAFLADNDPHKRDKLIDQLVERPEFADFWALKWADVLRSTRRTIQMKGSYGLQAWLRAQLLRNTPWDEVVRQLLTADGNTFAYPPANYYRIARDPQNLAETTAQLFFGIRLQCAKCHNHPFERWTQDDYYGFAAWFARVRLRPEPTGGAPANAANRAEIVYVERSGEVTQPRSGQVMKPRYLGVGETTVAPQQDRRAVLAAWLTAPDNPFFAPSVVNRVWFHLMGKGIVDPVDDFRDSNPPSNDALLHALTRDFVAHQFDIKYLVRTIMKSRTYQLSAQPNQFNADDDKYFSKATTKLLTAEQLLDALCDLTGVPEKFAGLPLGTRAIQLPDGEVNHPFLKAFGQPARELVCECERESEGNLGQALQLINGPTVNEKIRQPNNRLGQWLAAKLSDEAIMEQLYLAAYCRLPTNEERSKIREHLSKNPDRRKAWEDVLWAIINTREFLFRH
jgi:hypothetical protein